MCMFLDHMHDSQYFLFPMDIWSQRVDSYPSSQDHLFLGSFFFFLGQALSVELRLTLNSPYSPGLPETTHSPASASWILGLQM